MQFKFCLWKYRHTYFHINEWAKLLKIKPFFNFTGSNSIYSQTSQGSRCFQIKPLIFISILAKGMPLFILWNFRTWTALILISGHNYWIFFFSILQVRTRFIAKLHKGLARGLPFKCLPLDFLGFYAMVGMETDKTVREGTKRYMIGDINSRKDCIKTMTYSSCKFLTPVTYTVGLYLYKPHLRIWILLFGPFW